MGVIIENVLSGDRKTLFFTFNTNGIVGQIIEKNAPPKSDIKRISKNGYDIFIDYTSTDDLELLVEDIDSEKDLEESISSEDNEIEPKKELFSEESLNKINTSSPQENTLTSQTDDNTSDASVKQTTKTTDKTAIASTTSKQSAKTPDITPEPSVKQTAKIDINSVQIKVYKDGVYTGHLNELGLKHGKGTFKYNSGNEYNGNWKNDKMSGYGVYYSNEGWRYEGNFENNQFHGKGKYYNEKGKLIKEGNWSNGKLIN